ncbi:site-2 protease family protein [Actinomadura sp. WMMB 499]|uniref:site-2 protease family protein n=1 Tax=Actinomadura sp. WMMB 499 TaxID=1219491 RepID=UPI001245D5FB|nr:site-2 protease family protein [Actinomadura sp. WMMB 499]QFG24272.1 site-2 protease family protein [Actinomadura sp. WMMB 499]
MTEIAHGTRGGSAVRPSPVFLVIMAATALAGLVTWRYGQITDQPARIALFVFVLAGWVLSLCLHEFGHAYTAFRSGDHSVATKGYLTLNPFKYADMVLSFAIPVLFILLGGIGLPGGAVWIDRHSIRGKIRHSLISAAGPLSNVLFAVVLAVLINTLADDAHSVFWVGVAFLAFLQVTAAILNLLPIPGLDGFGIIEPYLPRGLVRQANQYAGYAFLVLVALLWLGPINEGFFNLVFYITDSIGLEELQIAIGHALFQFWQD